MSWKQLYCDSGESFRHLPRNTEPTPYRRLYRTGNCTKILFVADPQILGEQNDRSWYSSWAIWDSDRFLRNTFRRAIAHSWPDAVCFLGDLMDEGSIASDEQHERYADRFRKVFPLPAHTRAIHAAGDNDIGGEGDDRVTGKKIARFANTFHEQNVVVLNKRHRIINCNMITRNFPDVDPETVDDFVNVAISHMSILSFPGLSMKTVSAD